MTWEDILKLSPEDRKEFNELGDKYAPEDMSEGRAKAEREAFEKTKDKRNSFYQRYKKELHNHEDFISPRIYRVMLRFLEDLKDSKSQEEFEKYRTAIRSLAATIPNFHIRSRRK